MQNNLNFQVVTHGKCILAGEHAVLRGYPALVAPVHSRKMILTYREHNEHIKVNTNMPYAETFLLFFWRTLEQCLANANKNLHDVHGEFNIQNNIEMGAGLGFSAALSVALTRWLIWEHWIKSKKIFHFAKSIEDSFHGTSSGVDIIGVISDHLVQFDTSGNVKDVQVHWRPKLYLSYSGYMKSTKKSIEKVSHLMKDKLDVANTLDQDMFESVRMFEEALSSDEKHGMKGLIAAIELANHCFTEWGLISPGLQQYMDKLKQKGAIAVKPTGAGDGGFVLSLWLKEPNEVDGEEFIPVF